MDIVVFLNLAIKDADVENNTAIVIEIGVKNEGTSFIGSGGSFKIDWSFWTWSSFYNCFKNRFDIEAGLSRDWDDFLFFAT